MGDTRSSVLFLIDSLNPGGAERQLELSAKCLAGNRRLAVMSLGGGPFGERLEEAGIPVSVFRRSRKTDPLPFFRLARAITGWKPDIVHAWGWMSAAVGYAVCSARRVPLVNGTIRSACPGRGIKSFLTRRLLLASDRVLANSMSGIKAWRIPERLGRVIYNGFDPARLPLCRTVREPGPRRFGVVMVAGMNARKDFNSFLKALRILMTTTGETLDGFHFMAIGAGEDRTRLMEIGRDLVLDGALSFPECGLEVLPAVGMADVGVLMTSPTEHAEGCSNSIIEYMACALPVVCSDSGGNREIVADGETGILVPPGDSAALAAALGKLRESPKTALRMGEAGLGKFQEMFSLERLERDLNRMYDELS